MDQSKTFSQKFKNIFTIGKRTMTNQATAAGLQAKVEELGNYIEQHLPAGKERDEAVSHLLETYTWGVKAVLIEDGASEGRDEKVA